MKNFVPIIWSIADIDGRGGAGLAADVRAADALGVHCVTVISGVTVRGRTGMTHNGGRLPDLFQAQLDRLAIDMPPRVIKTGQLGSIHDVCILAAFVDRLREQQPLALVVDPVMRASARASQDEVELLEAYRKLLLPRASVITPNREEAMALLGQKAPVGIPEQARALCELGCEAVVITRGDAALCGDHDNLALDWLDTPHARGWLALPCEEVPHKHGVGCTFASALASALSLGWVTADAAVLAKMSATHALRHSRAVGVDIGLVIAREDFVTDPSLLPRLSLDEEPPSVWSRRLGGGSHGIYAIVDSAERVEAVLPVRHTVNTLQLRMKRLADMDDATWNPLLREEIARSQCAADAAGALLVVNDHWRVAVDAGAKALHLGQEDLLLLSPQDRADLQAVRETGVQLGISSHSLWELCRASALEPDLIACGPVWPTSTKEMPWRPQGLSNLAWWAHMAPAPVVGIGGILEPEQLQAVAAAGAAGGCLVSGLGEDPSMTLPGWQSAWSAGIEMRTSRDVLTIPRPTI